MSKKQLLVSYRSIIETPNLLQQASIVAGTFKLLKVSYKKPFLKRPSCFTPKIELSEKCEPSSGKNGSLFKKSTSTKYTTMQQERIQQELSTERRKVKKLETSLKDYKQVHEEKEAKLKRVFTQIEKKTSKVAELVVKAGSIISSPNKIRLQKGARTTGKNVSLIGEDKAKPRTQQKAVTRIQVSASPVEQLAALKNRLKRVLTNIPRRLAPQIEALYKRKEKKQK